jgi:hypothetical protein
MGSATALSTLTTQSTSSGATRTTENPKRNPCGVIDQQIDPERGWITGHLFARHHSIVLSLIDCTA